MLGRMVIGGVGVEGSILRLRRLWRVMGDWVMVRMGILDGRLCIS